MIPSSKRERWFGEEAKTRSGPTDAAGEYYFIDQHKALAADARVKAWRFFASTTNPQQLILFRKTATPGTYAVVGYSPYVTPKLGVNELTLAQPIEAKAGDLLGWSQQNGGAIAVEYFDGGGGLTNTSGRVLYSGANRQFTCSCNRVYSIEILLEEDAPPIEVKPDDKSKRERWFGEEAKTRSGPTDAAGEYYFIDQHKALAADARVKAWRFFASTTNPQQLILFRKTATPGTYAVVGYSPYVTPKLGVNELTLAQPIEAKAGDLLGWSQQNGGAIAVEYFDGGGGLTNTSGRVLYSGANRQFTCSCNRVYSIEILLEEDAPPDEAAEWAKARNILQDRIKELEDKLAACAACETKLAARDTTITELETKVAELEEKLEKCAECEVKLAARDKTIAALTERITQLEIKKPETDPPVWPPPSTPARVVISYTHFIGAEKGTQGDEYIEIKNTGGTAQDVAGWKVRAGSADQEFSFAAGSALQPGAVVRVYTNRPGGYSFGRKSALWNDTGDFGQLFDAAGKVVSEYGYGTREKRSVDSIKAAYGVEKMAVVYTDAQAAKQKRKNDKVDFLTALERAVRSLLHDPAEQDSPNAANQVRDNYEGVPEGASAELIERFIRDHMNKNQLRLLSEDSDERGDVGVSTRDHWIFLLDEGMGDRHWVIVDRMGAKDAYQEIT